MIRRRLDSSDAVSVPGTAPSSSSSAGHPSVVRFRQDVPATDSPMDQSQEQEQEQHQRPRSRSSTRSYSSGGTCDRDRDSVISEMAESGDVVDVRAVAAGTSEEDTSDNHRKEQRSRWSNTLRSPTAGGAFSPSLELNAKSSTSINTTSSSSSGTSASLHGLGLRAASDRARTLSKCGKRCATLLADVATLHDAWAKSMLQSCSNLAALDGSASSTGIFAPSVSPLLHETNRRLTSFAKQTQGLAICLRGSVARPLHGSSSAMAEASIDAMRRMRCVALR